MDRNSAKAVSFTNSYCTLADGLASGLENCLAENVVLDWFGKTIKCRSNVAAFMNIHKVNSRHIFDSIISSNSIGYNSKKRKRVRSKCKYNDRRSFCTNGNISIELQSSCESTPKTPTNGTISNSARSRSSLKKCGIQENSIEDSDITFELNDDDISKTFKLEKIQSTNIEEIERKISQISLEDRLKLMTPRKSDCMKANEIDNQNEEERLMNYIEAYGEILFSKKSRRSSGWGEKNIVSSSKTHTWRKPCKLQVAYTSHQVPVQQTSPTNNNNSSSKISCTKTGFQGLSDIVDGNKMSNCLVSNDNHLNNFFNTLSAENEKVLFENLDEHLSKYEANKLGFTPRCVNNHLVFHKKDCDNHNEQNNFVFNHTIHVIIYEGRSRCRVNLSQKFL